MESNFKILSLTVLASELRNYCLMQGHEGLHLFFSKSIIGLAFIFRSMIHFELIF